MKQSNKKNKLDYCIWFTEQLRRGITDTNLGPYMRYKVYRDIIVPMYKHKSKPRKRKGLT